MKKYDAVISGYICIDLIPDFKKSESKSNITDIFKPGRLIEIDGLSFCLGGVVANTGIAMKKFGNKVFLNGLVGTDFIGKSVLDSLEKYELSEGIQTTQNAGTAFSIVVAPPGTDRIFWESPGCSVIFDKSHINFEAISQSRLFHFGYPPLLKQFYLNNGALLSSLFSEIQKMGVVTSLDFSLPDTSSESGKIDWTGMMQRVLRFTDIFVPSLEEALQIMMPEEYARFQAISINADILDLVPVETIRILGKKIMDCGVKIIMIKAGHRGTYLLTDDVSVLNRVRGLNLSEYKWNHRELWCDAYQTDPARIKSATGSGDTAIAAFLTAVLGDETPDQAVKYASIAGRNNLYIHDIYEELPGWQEMTIELGTSLSKLIVY
jgi:sugar/nucleoside kinase (ribokinase family)